MRPSGPVPETWYFDSWNVLDGIAFASLRAPDADGAEVSVVMAPPDWAPVSLSRLSTGWAASRRGGFQPGLIDEEGKEVAFPSLDLLREFVRRAYIAGGLGSDNPGDVGVPVPPTLPQPISDLSISLLEAPDELDGPDVDASRVLRAFLRGNSPVDLWWTLGSHASSYFQTAIAWSHGAPGFDRDGRPDALGLLELFANFDPGLATSCLESMDLHLRHWPRWPWAPSPASVANASRSESRALRLLARLPALAPVGAQFPRPRTLADQLLLACASRAYLSAHQTLEQALPLLLAAVIVGNPANEVALWQRADGPDTLLGDALLWLYRQVPDDRLEAAHLEALLDHTIRTIADYRLNGRAQGNVPPHGSRPSKSRLRRSQDPSAEGGLHGIEL